MIKSYNSLERSDNIYRGHYLLTIQKVRKKDYVPVGELEQIRDWIEANGAIFHQYIVEAHGKYKQPHLHAHVYYPGQYKHLTKYGDGEHFPIYQILWKKVTNYKGLHKYINKFHPALREQQIYEHYYQHHYYNGKF